MEYINYIGEDVDLHLHNYSDAEFLPGSIKNIYNNEKSSSYSNSNASVCASLRSARAGVHCSLGACLNSCKVPMLLK